MDPFDRPELIAHTTKSTRENASPGPAAYNTRRDFIADKTPIHFHNRTNVRTKTTQAPYYNVATGFGKVTKITLHDRTKSREGAQTPGPSYIPPRFGSDSRFARINPPSETSLTIGKGKESGGKKVKRKNRAETPGPGPSAYNCRDKSFDRPPPNTVRIKGHHAFGNENTCSPGPGRYNPSFKAVLPSAPKYGMHIRPKDKEPEGTPGYRQLTSTLGGVKYTIKPRETDDIYIM